MSSRLTMILAGALVIWAGTASASPSAEDGSSAPTGRMHAIAARMARGESYDQATQKVIQAAHDDATDTHTSLVSIYGALMANGASYDQATSAARKTVPEATEAINRRWAKHLAAMEAGGAHEAGWNAAATE